MNKRISPVGFLVALLLAVLALLPSRWSAAVAPPPGQPRGMAGRVPWTTSRIRGTPEPPHPYRVGRAFPKLTFKNPLLMTRLPGTKLLLVGEQAGKVLSFPNDQGCARADLFVDLRELNSW